MIAHFFLGPSVLVAQDYGACWSSLLSCTWEGRLTTLIASPWHLRRMIGKLSSYSVPQLMAAERGDMNDKLKDDFLKKLFWWCGRWMGGKVGKS